ncbi:MAG: ATP-binding protein [Chloroflexota bacterium]
MNRWQTMLRQHPWLRRFSEWAFLFLVLLLALWGATQQRETPQLVLLLFLYVITFHFALPASFSSLSLMSVVALCSLLISDWQTAVILLLLGFILSELLRPLWHPIWENINLSQPRRLTRLGIMLRQLLAMSGAIFAYQQAGGTIPSNVYHLYPQLILTASHGFLFFLCSIPLWYFSEQSFRIFWQEQTLSTAAIGLLTVPFGILGSFTFWHSGMPAFVIYCFGIMIANIFLWLMWERRYTLNQYVTQFSALNSVGTSLRETLDLSTVIQRTYQEVANLIVADQFTVWLIDEAGEWQQPHTNQPIENHLAPNDFIQWVASRRRILEINSRNIHFAARHGLTPPEPLPTAWLGVPLVTVDQIIGVIVIQRTSPNQRFSRWTRELFLAIANQASAAIQNARLHGETLRLYNLTDEALAQRLRQLQALLNSIQDGVLMLNRTGEVVLINPMAQTLLPAETQIGKPLPAQAAAKLGYQPTEWLKIVSELAKGDVEQEGETAVLYQTTLNNQTRTIERSQAPVLTQNNQLLGWLMLFRDVTTAQELAERRTDLTHMIVHDLRNPITTIISNLNLTTHQLPSNGAAAAAQELLADAHQACRDMLDMVDSLMDINRMEAGQAVIDPEAMNLGRLATSVVERLQPLAQRQAVSLRLEQASDTPPVWADAEMIRRVLVNLLDNGLKFTPTGGQVVCRIMGETDFSANTGQSGYERYEAGARCEISDTGPGIPTQSRELIFDRYMRTNEGGAQVRGTGLGLTFCKMVVEAHNGRIWVEEDAGGGSKFVFTLPGIPVFSEQ